MAEIHIPHNHPSDTCGDKETLHIHFDQDYTLCSAHPESFTGAMGGLPVGRHYAGFDWWGHPDPKYTGSRDVLYCFEPGNTPCMPCQPVAPPGTPPGHFAGHIIHVGGRDSPITSEDIKRFVESLESIAHTETFRASWPPTLTLLQELIALKRHPVPESIKKLLELMMSNGQSVYEGITKKD